MALSVGCIHTACARSKAPLVHSINIPSPPAARDAKIWRAQARIYFLELIVINSIKARRRQKRRVTCCLCAHVSGICYSILSSIGFSQNDSDHLLWWGYFHGYLSQDVWMCCFFHDLKFIWIRIWIKSYPLPILSRMLLILYRTS